MTELEQLHAEIARLREALTEMWGCSTYSIQKDGHEYCVFCLALADHLDKVGHAPGCPFTALSSDDDWLERHDAERDAKICELGNEVIRLTKLVARQQLEAAAPKEGEDDD